MTRRRRRLTGLLAVEVVSLALLLPIFDRGWIPHDEGQLAQSAELVLAGKLPHRDFDEMYTGGHELFHAAAFRIFGVRLFSLRLFLLFASLAFAAALYAAAARLASPGLAVLLVLPALAWSLPIYFAALPSWYVLFFSVGTVLGILRFLETGRGAWLFAAGLAAGFAFTMKSVGVFTIAAGLLSLLFVEQERPRAADTGGNVSRAVVLAGLASFVALLTLLVLRHHGPMELLHFLLPGAALAALLAGRQLGADPSVSPANLSRLARTAAPFVLGVAIPLLVLVSIYVVSGALGDLAHGLFVLPARRFDVATKPFPPLWTLTAVLPPALLLLGRWRPGRGALAALSLALAALAACGSQFSIYRAVWNSVRPLVPLAALTAVMALSRPGTSGEIPPAHRSRVFLLVTTASLVSFVQYPYPFGVYFGYIAPLVVLALASLVLMRPHPGRTPLAVLGFYTVFGLLWLTTGHPNWAGVAWVPRLDTAILSLPRGGLRVPDEDARIYRALVAEIAAHSAPGDFVYAAPDCPEVNFLSGRRSPVRTMYDFFEEDFGRDPEGRRRRLLGVVERDRVNVVVLARSGEFSGAVDPILLAELAIRFPHARQIGDFSVRWRL